MKHVNIISVDVEDYFQVEAFSKVVGRESWDSYPCRVEANNHRLLDLFDETGVKGTFFILGWVAERYPQLVREITKRGHEPACHSYWHNLIYDLTPAAFRADTIRAKTVIEQACGLPIHGYRAPSFSVVARSSWAFDVLAETGFRYDSSVFPVKHDTYGIPGAPRLPFKVKTESGTIVEFPMTTFRLGVGGNMPLGGGGYLRILPDWYTRLGVRKAAAEGVPIVCYLHPWEVDPEQPRIAAKFKSRLRHYTNLEKMEDRLRRLISLVDFTTFQASDLVEVDELQTVRL